MRNILSKYPLMLPIVLGFVTGWVLYGTAVTVTHYNLIQKIKAVTVRDVLVKGDPALESTFLFRKANQRVDLDPEDFILRTAKSLGLVNRDDPFEKVSGLVKKALSDEMETLTSIDPTQHASGITLLLSFAKNIGAHPDEREIDELRAEEIISRCFAQAPFALENYSEALMDSSYDEVAGRSYYFAHYFPVDAFWEPATTDQIMQRMFKQYRIADHFVPLDKQLTTQFPLLAPSDEYAQTKELFNRLFLNLITSESVSTARDWVMVFKGPMQLLMFIVFFVAIFLMFFPFDLTQQTVTKQKRNQLIGRRIKVFDFCEETLPVLGFIGTILGLMAALGDAYKIPVADGSTNSALAISSITTTLSIAFTTTLMAFVLKIFLDVIKIAFENKQLLEDEKG